MLNMQKSKLAELNNCFVWGKVATNLQHTLGELTLTQKQLETPFKTTETENSSEKQTKNSLQTGVTAERAVGVPV